MNENNRRGALPSQDIKQMMKDGIIMGANDENIAPASLDLTISDEIYRVGGFFLPHPKYKETIKEILKMDNVSAIPHDIKNPLEKNVVYCVRLNETFNLPKDIYGYSNPKSTTGRNDIHVRLLANKIPRYDKIEKGYSGSVWLMIMPKSFPVIVRSGQRLVQIRFSNQDTRVQESELPEFFEKYSPFLDKDGKKYKYEDMVVRDDDGSVLLTIDLSQDIKGWECRGVNNVLDFNKEKGYYQPEDFFRKIKGEGNRYMNLKKDQFYILSTNSVVRIPPNYACEMIPVDEKTGEFRSHYAGFIDPGWGWGKDGEGKGRQLTLEVRPFEDMVIRHGQVIAKVIFEKMAEIPEVTYDERESSNYGKQHGPRLAKYFKD